MSSGGRTGSGRTSWPHDPGQLLGARVDRNGDCWLWKGCQTKGYGVVARSGRQTYAHRYAHEITHGPIPKGSYVCHRCDQPLCCRPEHLFLGSQTDNMRDAAAKGRVARGERNGQAEA